MYGVSNNKVFTAIPDTGKKNIKVTDTISGLKSVKIDGVPVNFKIGASEVTVNLVTFLTAESKKKVNHTVESIDCTNNKITYKFIIDSYLPNITVENKNGNEISSGGWTNSRVYVVANDKYLYGTNAKGEKVYKTASGIKCITIDNIKVSNGGGLKELKEGKHTIRAYDNAGNKRAFTFNYDSKMPSFSSVKNGGFYDSLKFSTKDYGSGLASVLILKNTNDKTKGTSGALNDNGVYTNTFNSAGCYKIIATDKAGNRREVTFTIR